MKERVEMILNVALVVAAMAVATAAVDRQLLSGRAGSSFMSTSVGPPEYVDNWQQWLDDGVLLGAPDAPIKIVEFADLECPFCRRFHTEVGQVAREYGDSMALVFIHYPLRMHRFAMPAAVAAECAVEEDHFGSFIDAVFTNQDSLGLKTWSSYARDAGIQDTSSFAECILEHKTFPRIERGRALGEAVGVRGTPTVVINGWRFPVPPYDSLAVVIDRLMNEGKPFKAP